MFGWRRKNDGFEWHEYVRTTILIRRKARKEKIGEVQQAALDGIASAGQRGVDAGAMGLKAAGQGLSGAAKSSSNFVVRWSQIAIARMQDGLKRFRNDGLPAMAAIVLMLLGLLMLYGGRLANWVYEKLAFLCRAGGGALVTLATYIGSVVAPLARPELALPVGVISIATAAGAVGEFLGNGLSAMFFVALILSLAAGAFVVSCLWEHGGSALAQRIDVSRFSERLANAWPFNISLHGLNFRRLGIAAGVVTGVGVIGALGFFFVPPADLKWFEAASETPTVRPPVKRASVERLTISGFAKSLSGDQLSIQETVINLSGIEAPELDQKCVRNNGSTWRCGKSALRALQKITGRHKVVCEVGETNSSGIRNGTCLIGEKDIASELVRKGYVFAAEDFFSTYASQQSQAQAEKLELWRGKALRPKAFRRQVWKIAAQKAPNGCPVKGSILSSRGKVYLMPWSKKYGRTRIRTKRGERWFCSEKEALDAGWKPYRRL